METFLWSLLIFVSRITDVTLGTIRVNMIVRRKKLMAAMVGFFEVIIFVSIIVRVVRDLSNFYSILAYGAGFACGTLIGITISERLSKDLVSTNIISKNDTKDIEDELRREGFGATSYVGNGKEGSVKIINVVCRHSNLPELSKIVCSMDPNAFIVSHTLEDFRGGYFYGMKSKK